MSREQSTPRVPRSLKVLLLLLSLSAFMTEVKFVPGIANNIGPFEILLGFMALLTAFGVYGRGRIVLHPLSVILICILATATVSVAVVDRLELPLLQLVMLTALVAFCLLMHNLIRRYRLSPEIFLVAFVYSIVLISPWLLSDQILDGGVEAAGPFRNRAHMGTYMLTSFWIALTASLWPGLSSKQRAAAFLGLVVCLYAIAVAGRRSLYLSLGLGLPTCFLLLLASSRANRVRIATAGGLVLLLGTLLYTTNITSQASFFQERIWMVGARLEMALGIAESAEEESFMDAQRRGVRMAVTESPIIGIGWGGFADSRFSPTGHEVHSTPLRFLAETGIIGLGFYLAFLSLLLGGSILAWVRVRKTPFSASYITFAVALCSMSISWLYNRHITERSFWLVLAIWFAMTSYARTLRSEVPASAPDATREVHSLEPDGLVATLGTQGMR